MPLFAQKVNETPEAELLAAGFLLEANKTFDKLLSDAYSASDRFWFRNRDEEGNPSTEGGKPSGLEILAAMGTDTQAFMGVAYARVQMLVAIATSLGQAEAVDLTRLMPPVTIEYNKDGSLYTQEDV